MAEKRSILVALSGGVDSSVTAALLKDSGYEVVAVTLKTFCYGDFKEGPKSCCGLEGVAAARSVASKLGIQHFVVDVSDRFKSEVIENFTKEYSSGRTPNPCVICNATVKIPDLYDKALSLGCDSLATGHYARIQQSPDGFGLYRGSDRAKDQSYFLWKLPRKILPNLKLPLENLTKDKVREIAQKYCLTNADRPESQEICFIPDGDYVSFLKKLLPVKHKAFKSGDIIDSDGNKIGRHDGTIKFTIGQRKGIGGGNGRKLYVTGIDVDNCVVRVGEYDKLLKKTVFITDLNFLSDEPVSETKVELMIRHRFKPISGTLKNCGNGFWRVDLDADAAAVTPGQSAVFFSTQEPDRLLGGGVIINEGSRDP
ncbi:MAG: tRNA 2-thiouridine(34) synthase MnmA [Candidatus Riflebacteria bacterium]|nr:tRNA 2-thiouridine(34) synthase MnmA [Candidatus Riflebacteria bacterium]